MSADNPLKILIVEDEKISALTLKGFLENRFGAEVVTAQSAAEAREAFGSHCFDVVTLDYLLPDATGLELLDEIGALEYSPVVIMVTGQGGEQIASEALIRGASGYVVKDARMRQVLAAAIEKAIAERDLAQAREELLEPESRYRMFLDIAEVIFVALDRDGVITLVNTKCNVLLGYEPGELLGKDWFETCVPGHQRAEVRSVFDQIMSGNIEMVAAYENRVLTRDGAQRLVAWRNAYLRDDAGNIVGTLSSGEDVTERRMAEKALTASEYRFRTLGAISREVFAVELDYESTVDAICRCASRALGDLCVIRVLSEDAQTLEVVGVCHRDEEAMMFAKETLSREMLESTEELMRWATSAGRSRFVPAMDEKHMRAMEGRAFWPYVVRYGASSFMMAPLRFKGQVFGTISASRDAPGPAFTDEERVLLEEIADRAAMAIDRARLHARLEAELESGREREKELEGFAHAVSHDLKGPISTTRTGVEILREALRDPDFGFTLEDMELMLDKLASTMDASSTLIDELLTLAESGHVPDMVREVDVSDVVDRAVEMLAPEIEEKMIDIRVDEDMGSVVANPTHVYQVFSNLISNAVKHNDSPEPVIEVRNLGFSDGAHRYLVTDNGSGIPEAYLGGHFMPFFQAKGGGKVMGLAIVDRVLGVYGGGIMAYNKGGANFDFVIRDYVKGEGD